MWFLCEDYKYYGKKKRIVNKKREGFILHFTIKKLLYKYKEEGKTHTHTHTLRRMKREKLYKNTWKIPCEIVCPQCRLTVFHFYDETQFSTVYCMPIKNIRVIQTTCERVRVRSNTEANSFFKKEKKRKDTIAQHGMYSIKIIVMLCKADFFLPLIKNCFSLKSDTR